MNMNVAFRRRFSFRFWIGIVAFFSMGFISAQEHNSLLWKIEGNGLNTPSYLFGTIHAICEQDFFVKEATEEAIASVQQIVLELDMDDPQLVSKLQGMMINEGMKNISSDFSEEQLELVNSFFQKHYGGDLTRFGIFKPLTLLSMVVQKSITCENQKGYEEYLVQRAVERNVEVIGVETVEYQSSI